MTSEGNRELFPANIDRSRELFSKICKRKRFFFVSYIILFPKNLNVSQINCFLRNQSIRFYLCLLVQKHNKNTYGLLLFKVFLYSEENEDFGYPLLSSIIFITTIQTTQKQLILLYSQTFTQLNRDCHWLILGHVALTEIKCIPISDTLNNIPRSGYITARDQSMVESGVREGGKNTASFLFRE